MISTPASSPQQHSSWQPSSLSLDECFGAVKKSVALALLTVYYCFSSLKPLMENTESNEEEYLDFST